jgi:hypothetical protein
MVWSLSSAQEVVKPDHHWFQDVILNLSDHQVDTTVLVAWRAWFARNEATHDKVLPPLESSKCFLSSYLNLILNIKDVPTDAALKGKRPLLISAFGEEGDI